MPSSQELSPATAKASRFGDTPEAFAAGLLAAVPDGFASDLLSERELDLAEAAEKAGALAFIPGGFGATDYYVPPKKFTRTILRSKHASGVISIIVLIICIAIFVYSGNPG